MNALKCRPTQQRNFAENGMKDRIEHDNDLTTIIVE